MKCDRRWWNDGRLELAKQARDAWQARRPEWGFTMHANGDIIGSYSRPLVEWWVEKYRIEALVNAAAYLKPDPLTREELAILLSPSPELAALEVDYQRRHERAVRLMPEAHARVVDLINRINAEQDEAAQHGEAFEYTREMTPEQQTRMEEYYRLLFEKRPRLMRVSAPHSDFTPKPLDSLPGRAIVDDD